MCANTRNITCHGGDHTKSSHCFFSIVFTFFPLLPHDFHAWDMSTFPHTSFQHGLQGRPPASGAQRLLLLQADSDSHEPFIFNWF